MGNVINPSEISMRITKALKTAEHRELFRQKYANPKYLDFINNLEKSVEKSVSKFIEDEKRKLEK